MYIFSDHFARYKSGLLRVNKWYPNPIHPYSQCIYYLSITYPNCHNLLDKVSPRQRSLVNCCAMMVIINNILPLLIERASLVIVKLIRVSCCCVILLLWWYHAGALTGAGSWACWLLRQLGWPAAEYNTAVSQSVSQSVLHIHFSESSRLW